MKAFFLTLAMTAFSVAQPADQSFVGTWTAKCEGRTFVRLELTTVNGALGGGLSLGTFQVNPQGVVKSVETAPSILMPIFGVVRKGAIVTFFMKDGDDANEFQLHLQDGTRADLHIILSEADRKEFAEQRLPAPKPIRLSRGEAGRIGAGE